MSESLVFRPPRRRGLIILIGAALLLAAGSAGSFLVGLEQTASGYFVALLLVSLLLFAPLPLIVYRAYSLLRAGYRLERDGLRLRWGLRAEDIPLPQIEWARRAADLAFEIPRPRIVLPGTLRGTVQVRDFGPVEYMASTRETLVLVATHGKAYAISPENPEQFLRAFQRTLEMGSLTPLASVSVLPVAYLAQVWMDRLARWVLAGGLLLALLVFAGTALVIPARQTVSLGFYPNGLPLPPVPSEQLVLLPILGSFVYLADLAIGLFFYRRENSRLVAYLMWGAALFTEALFLVGLFNIASVSA